MKDTSQSWLQSLRTENPEAGYQLAIKLARMAVKLTQPSAEIREKLRPGYAEDARALIAGSHVVAVHFATVAAANNWWRESDRQ